MALEQEGIADDTLFVYLTDNGMPFWPLENNLIRQWYSTPYIWQWKNELPVGRTCTSLTSTVDFAPTLLEVGRYSARRHDGRARFLPRM